MNSTMEKLEKSQVLLEMEVDKDTFETAMQKSYIKNIKQLNIPGFRKGKAPRKMVEKMYGEAVFYDDAINFVFPDVYEAAIEEHKIEPVDRPEVDVKQFPEDGLNLILTATLTVKPEVLLGDIDDIQVTKPVYEVSDEDVNKELETMQSRNARIISIEDRPAKLGDTAIIDYEGFLDGTAFEGGKGEGHNLELGSGQFIPGFEEQIVDKNIGDEFDVNLTFPEEYHAEDLAGKAVVFKVALNGLKTKEVPALDDEFAKDVSEFDTLDELKTDLLTKLNETNENKVKQEIENAVVDAVIERMSVEIPEAMYENRIGELIQDFDMRLSYQGMNVQKYLEYTGMSIDDFKGQFKDQAEKQVSGMLALGAVAKKENVEATGDDIQAEYAKMAEQYKMEIDKIKELVNEDDLKRDIINNKTIEMLVGRATIV